MKRRTLLRAAFVSGLVTVTGILSPRRVLASANFIDIWENTKSVQAVLLDLYGTSLTISRPEEIKIIAPPNAEDRNNVYVSVSTTLIANSIAIIVEKKSSPLCFYTELSEKSLGFVSTAIRMSNSSDIIVVIESEGVLYSARKNVIVTLNSNGNE